jgi:two-component system, sensor histidine kinase and response regulator
LDLSKIQAGKIEFETLPLDLERVLEECTALFAPAAESKGVELIVCPPEAESPTVHGDPLRVRQIVLNLVGNAVKFTEEGEVELKVRVELEEDTRCTLHFTVSDTGIGIAAEKLELIFESFSQADASTTRVFGGTGLGLTISRHLVHMMKGRIWVESTPGKGSCFHFTVPFGRAKRSAASKQGAGPSAIPAGVNVLIVDDNRTNRRILERLVTLWGMKPSIASDGAEALELYNAADAAGHPFGLVLTDMHMPKMDGFGLVDSLKRKTGFSNSIIMMLTSGGQRGDVQRCEQLGIAAYLLKPVRQVELHEAVARVLSAGASAEAAPVITRYSLREAVQVGRSLNVLLAEDNPVNQKLAKRLLEKRNHAVTVVANGQEALDLLEKNSYDLVLMDMQMPVMDGFEATKLLRQREQATGKRQRVVAMTALAMIGDKERCMAAGMDGYLTKPIRPQEFDALLDSCAAGRGELQMPAPVTPAADSAIDVSELLERIDGDRSLLAELVDLFRADSPIKVRAVHDAIESRNAERLRGESHALKGALVNLSATRASALAAELEAIGKSGNLAQAQATLDRLTQELGSALEVLEGLCPASVK